MNICIFGDSITWGAYDPVNGGWATLLRNFLEEKGEFITTYNLGICGDNSSGLLKRFRIEAEPRKPDLIIFAIGANDIKHQKGKAVHFDEFEDNMGNLLTQAGEFTKKIVILGITPVDEKLTSGNQPLDYFRENKDVDRCNEILKTMAVKQNLVFIPIPKSFLETDLSDDGLHPNTNGHLKIFEIIKEKVSFAIFG